MGIPHDPEFLDPNLVTDHCVLSLGRMRGSADFKSFQGSPSYSPSTLSDVRLSYSISPHFICNALLSSDHQSKPRCGIYTSSRVPLLAVTFCHTRPRWLVSRMRSLPNRASGSIAHEKDSIASSVNRWHSLLFHVPLRRI
jgi:hypothetical protein